VVSKVWFDMTAIPPVNSTDDYQITG